MKSRSAFVPRLLLFASMSFAAAGCGRGGDEAGASPAGARLAQPPVGRAASAEVRAKTGLSHLPGPLSEDALRASMRRHYTPALRARGTGAVLLEVEVDDQGSVRGVEVMTPSAREAHPAHRAVISENGARQALELRYDPAFGEAARAAVRETRFTPAVRASDGRAVPFRWRMTIVFDSSLDA